MYSCNAVNCFHRISPGGLSLEIFVELFFQIAGVSLLFYWFVSPRPTIGALQSDNGDTNENVAADRLRVLWNFFDLILSHPVTWKYGSYVQTEERGLHLSLERATVKFIALLFLFSSKLKIWSFHVVAVRGWQRNVQKSVMHVQSCCFAHKTNCVLDVPTAVAIVVL